MLEMARRMSEESVIVAAKDQVYCDLAGEVIILNLKDGVYYGLNAVGTGIWHLIQKPITVSEIGDAIVEEYDVDLSRCRGDLLKLLRELAASGIIEVKGETPA